MKTSFIKKMVTFIVMAFLLQMNISFLATANVDSDSFKNTNINLEKWTKTLEFSPPQIYDNKDSVSIFVEEATYYTQQTGQPRLPYSSITKSFPLGTRIKDISCTYSDVVQINLDKPVELSPNLSWHGVQRNPDDKLVSLNDDIVSHQWFSYHLGGGLDSGEHVTFLSILLFPVQYDSEKTTLNYINEIKITVLYEPSVNKLTLQDTYPFVIIAPSIFKLPLQRLVDHKTENGLTTKLVTLRDIYKGKYFPVEGYDKPEKIKYFIKNAVEQWGTEYILLIGSIKKLPMRASLFGDFSIFTDMYYADLYFDDGGFCNWDSNGNHIYGEYWHDNKKDLVDLYADVYLGRLPCQNILEVFIVVNKIIRYESQTHDDWWDKIILVGGDTFPGWNGNEGEMTNDFIEEVLPDFNHVRIRTSDGTFNIDYINQEVSKGARFFEYSGHGFECGMGTYAPNGENLILYNTDDMGGMRNSYKLPVAFFDACLTAKLDYTLGEYLNHPKLFKMLFPVYAWYWVKKINGGAIASVGATEVAFSFVGENGPRGGAGYLSLHFFEGYHSCDTVSEMLVYSQNVYLNNLWKDHWTIEQFTLIGDPTLKVGDNFE